MVDLSTPALEPFHLKVTDKHPHSLFLLVMDHWILLKAPRAHISADHLCRHRSVSTDKGAIHLLQAGMPARVFPSRD